MRTYLTQLAACEPTYLPNAAVTAHTNDHLTDTAETMLPESVFCPLGFAWSSFFGWAIVNICGRLRRPLVVAAPPPEAPQEDVWICCDAICNV